jgi:hypothetical protein
MHRLDPKVGVAVALLSIIGWGAKADDPVAPHAQEVTPHLGEMVADIGSTDRSERQTLRFEPLEMLDDLSRSDIVLLMRHGPTDWNMRDLDGVAPRDCGHQRLMSPQGAQDMIDLGILLAGNGIRPSAMVSSEWCRATETHENLLKGFAVVDADYAAALPIQTDASLNLLLALQGAPNVTALRERVLGWDGGNETGPLLIVTHFTNIDELTEFHVYEGEILVLDPKRDGRVLGYLRLRSAGPDVGHFQAGGPEEATRAESTARASRSARRP